MINRQEIAELQQKLIVLSEMIHTAIHNIDASEILEDDPEYRFWYLRDLIWAAKQITALCEDVKPFKIGGTK